MTCYATASASCAEGGAVRHATGEGRSPSEALQMAYNFLLMSCPGGKIENFQVVDMSCRGLLGRAILTEHFGVKDDRLLPKEPAEEESVTCFYDGKQYSPGASCPDGSGKTCRTDGNWW